MHIKDYCLENVLVPFVETNCYFLILNKDAILVDTAGDGEILYKYINNNNLNLKAILITHGHYDHIEALDFLCDKYKEIKIYANKDEKDVIENNRFSLMDHSLNDSTLESITYLDDGSIIDLINLNIKMINTPGHTKGSTSYYIEDLKILFSGDTLFKDTYGRCDLPTGDMKKIAKSVGIELMKLPDDTLVFPGHGDHTTIGYERKNNDLTKDYVVNWANE